jgi:BirA family biotin operon repressor/biotin-[acetyl-CoA-carboxylase] ligase
MSEQSVTCDECLARLSERLRDAALATLDSLEWLAEVDSTNTRLLAQACPVHARVLIADQQSAGRGRLGRVWSSSRANAMLLSVALPLRGGLAAAQSLSLAVGVVLVEALHELGVDSVRLKWPNDLIVGEHKLGGVLIELSSAPQPFVVIGVGLNLYDAPAVDRPTTDLARCGLDCRALDRRIELFAACVLALRNLDVNWLQADTRKREQLLERWCLHHAYQDCEVILELDGRVLQGRVQGIDSHGALQVAHAMPDAPGKFKVASYHSGEVRLRGVRRG